MGADFSLGQGDEYEVRGDLALVHADEKTVLWRRKEFVRLGFSMGEAQTLAPRREAELRDIERWLDQGASHAQVLAIVAPLEVIIPSLPAETSTELALVDQNLHQGV